MGVKNYEVAGKHLSLIEVFGDIPDPRVAGRSKHNLVEILVVTVCALVCGVDEFTGVEAWANERIDWLRKFLELEHEIPSHDTFCRLFGLLNKHEVEKSFRLWVSHLLPALEEGTVVAIDGKASRRSRSKGQQALHMVGAFATRAGLILGQETCAEKSNELTAIPLLLEALLLKGAIVTIDAMGTHGNIARAIREKEADYVLAVKDNQPKLAESIATFFEIGAAENWKDTPHTYTESVEKDHGRLEVRRCWAFDQLNCLSEPGQWTDLKMFGVIETERTISNETTGFERRLYIGSIAPDAAVLADAVRAHWGIENRVHWCLDVALNDDQMRARMNNAGANLAIIRRMVLNLFRTDKSKRKVGIPTKRILAASSDSYREALLGLREI